MSARGEFNFQIAAQAHTDGVLSNDEYSGVVWSLLVVTLVTPVWFRVAFRHPPPDAAGPQGALGAPAATSLDAPVVHSGTGPDTPVGTASISEGDSESNFLGVVASTERTPLVRVAR